MKLQQLRYLLAIVDCGLNITAAAERLHTSQPGVSKQLKLLEEELGLQLFVRKGRSLAGVTAAGLDVVARARRVMEEIQGIKRLGRALYEEESGRLAIATTHTQARYVLPAVVQAFRTRYPEVTLDLHQGTSEQIASMAEQRQIDFAIASGSQHLFPDLVLLPCYHWERSIIVPRAHPLAQLERAPTLADLAEHPLVSYVFSFTGESSLKRAFAQQGLNPRIVFTARDADIIKTYVRMGLGVGIVASMAADCEENLTVIDGRGLFPRSTTWIGFRRDVALKRYMVEFIELFAPHLTRTRIERAVALPDQAAVDALFAELELPVRGGCPADAAEPA
jgi:LysR family cys regulon transcriptional activator